VTFRRLHMSPRLYTFTGQFHRQPLGAASWTSRAAEVTASPGDACAGCKERLARVIDARRAMTNQSRNQQKYLAAAVTTCAPQARPLVTHLKAGHKW
jgi:hypothetical protein